MGLGSNAMLVFVLLTVSLVASNGQGRTFIVGGSQGWRSGVNYTDWAIRNSPFYINDKLGDKSLLLSYIFSGMVHQVAGTLHIVSTYYRAYGTMAGVTSREQGFWRTRDKERGWVLHMWWINGKFTTLPLVKTMEGIARMS
ncbi:uncharacterized protein LOC120011464 isoform X2 [Tripterygium wilfordii]|uniref:uncharacterized protein LOC120011464 isoform X2 n=1 Tax=Tripterygium wilfordii TaxID=458696 RepID=UPI0018F7E9BB|nr:uncharacterized protein LOC120011464 isoform X2 [Tripterygium wilfordii]